MKKLLAFLGIMTISWGTVLAQATAPTTQAPANTSQTTRQQKWQQFQKNHPKAAQRMQQQHQERQQDRQQFAANHPKAAQRIQGRRQERRQDRQQFATNHPKDANRIQDRRQERRQDRRQRRR